MKTIKILATVAIALFIFCIVGSVIFAILPDPSDDHTTTTTKSDLPTLKPDNDVVLGSTEDAGQKYIDKIYFIGDSTTYHFFKGGIDKSHLLVPDSLTLMLASDILDIKVSGTSLTIPEAVQKNNAEIVIITVGVNGADSFSETKYKHYYQKLIDGILSLSPNTDIILQSVFPVTEWYSEKDNGISNESIDRLNAWAKELAAANDLKYLDTQSVLKNEKGAQNESYGEGDGVHMNEDAYREIVKYIRTHALKQG